MRVKLIRLITFLGGIYFFLEFVLPKVFLDSINVSKYHEAISDGFVLVGSMAFGLGLINLFLSHGSKIAFVRKGWFNSLVLLLGLIITMTVAGTDWRGQNEVQKKVATISNIAEFARHIQKGIESKQAGLPDLNVRLQKLLETYETAEQTALIDSDQVNAMLERELAEDKLALLVLNEQHTQMHEALKQIANTKQQLNQANLDLPDTSNALTTFASQVGQVSSSYGQILRQAAEVSLVSRLWQFIFNGLFVALGSAMFSLLGVYIASAAYRAFRVRSFESSLMMITAIVVMLGQIPFGIWLYDGLPSIRLWLLEYPNSAVFRAIKIGAAVAGLVMALRMWFSIESDYSKKAVK